MRPEAGDKTHDGSAFGKGCYSSVTVHLAIVEDTVVLVILVDDVFVGGGASVATENVVGSSPNLHPLLGICRSYHALHVAATVSPAAVSVPCPSMVPCPSKSMSVSVSVSVSSSSAHCLKGGGGSVEKGVRRGVVETRSLHS